MPEVEGKHVHGIAGWRKAALWPLVTLLGAWGRTLRFEAEEGDRALLEQRDGPAIFVLWHNRLFAAPEIFRRYFPTRRVHALVSASKDGAWLAEFFELAGLGTVRGSSSSLGREALHALAERLRAGEDVGITPDGPRGPAYKLKGGGVILARKSGRPCLLLGIRFESAWRLPSWDRFYLPKPWSRVRLSVERRTAEQLRDSTDPIREVEADMIRMNPDRLSPAGGIERDAEPRGV